MVMMANASKRKGDGAEREIAALLADLTGWPVRRKLGAGRADDTGDLDGIPDTTIQVKYRPGDVARAIREGVAASQVQQANAGTTFGVALIRRPIERGYKKGGTTQAGATQGGALDNGGIKTGGSRRGVDAVGDTVGVGKRGDQWVAVLTLHQLATLLREATATDPDSTPPSRRRHG